ncbi:MAG: hypothetical protein WDO17_09900 [Alphaproteobacteria bacterium]
MAIVIAVALVPASVSLSPISSARPSACRQEIVTVETPALEDPVILQSLRPIESDWSGFVAPDSTNVPAK